jgi:hypothetical protein
LAYFPGNFQRLFPQDRLLADLGAEAYLGMSLLASDGSPLDLLAVVNDGPMADPEIAVALLLIVATRAGAELEFMRYA